jgi:uracil-DNA glycosylase
MTIYTELPFFQKQYYEVMKKIERSDFIPGYGNLIRAFDQVTSTKKTQVLILGQDPYPTPGHANGLAFSVSPNIQPLPRSLRNIFKELVDDIGCPPPRNGDLTPWCEQGVLLLNTVLTTEKFKPNAHAGMGWEELAKQVITAFSNDTKQRVFILWGRYAQAYEKYIDQEKHLVIKSAHPSPLSASYGFFGSKPFSKANAYLKRPIDWSLEGQKQPVVKKKKKASVSIDNDWTIIDDQPSIDPSLYFNTSSYTITSR